MPAQTVKPLTRDDRENLVQVLKSASEMLGAQAQAGRGLAALMRSRRIETVGELVGELNGLGVIGDSARPALAQLAELYDDAIGRDEGGGDD